MARKRPSPPPKALRAIWEKIPSMIDCKGKCSNSCGPIDCSSLEKRLIEQRAGKRLATDSSQTCTMLRHGRCSVYSIRPVICRLWGVVEGMPCPHGCKSERVLSDREGLSLMLEAMELAGDDVGRASQDFIDKLPEEILEKMREWALGAPDLGGVLRNRGKASREFLDALARHTP